MYSSQKRTLLIFKNALFHYLCVFEKLIWISKVLVHLPNNEDSWVGVIVLCVQLFFLLGCWIQEFRSHWKTLPENLCASALPFPCHSLWLLLAIFLSVERWFFFFVFVLYWWATHNDEISSGIQIVISRELTTRT